MRKEDLDEHQAIIDETCRALENAHQSKNQIDSGNSEDNSIEMFDSILVDSMISRDQHSSDAESIEALARELNRHYSEYNEGR